MWYVTLLTAVYELFNLPVCHWLPVASKLEFWENVSHKVIVIVKDWIKFRGEHAISMEEDNGLRTFLFHTRQVSKIIDIDDLKATNCPCEPLLCFIPSTNRTLQDKLSLWSKTCWISLLMSSALPSLSLVRAWMTTKMKALFDILCLAFVIYS